MKPIKAEARQKKLIKDAEQKILNLTDNDKFEKYLDVLAKFHLYSSRNISLIYLQNSTASRIASFKKWETDFNRQVKKDEKPIQIAVPTIKKLPLEKREIVGYRYIPVFDIKQTTGEYLLNIKCFVKEHLTEQKNITALFDEFKKYLNNSTNLKVSEKPLAKLGGAKGYFIPKTNEIVIGEDEADVTLKLKTLYHEYAYSQLYGLTSEFKDRPQKYKETQAEAVAYVVMQNIGVDISDYSLRYVATWAKDQDLIHSALSEIQKVGNKTIEITDILTNKLGLQEELQEANKMSVEKLNSQYISLSNTLKGLKNKQTLNLVKLAQAKETNNQDLVNTISQEIKDTQQIKDKLAVFFMKVRAEISKQVQRDLDEFEQYNPKIK